MAYNEFSLPALIRQFQLRVEDQPDLFGGFTPVPVSDLLRETLAESVPLALDVSTEKVRSELIIAPVLMEVRRQSEPRISLFSGVEFNVDIERGLRGVCDYLLSLSPLQLAIEAPVIAVVEAKNENMKAGISQCIAEMVAAQVFNREQGNEIATIYGVVTTGTAWRFLRLDDRTVLTESKEYPISDVERIVGILTGMVREAAAHAGEKATP